MNNKLQELTEKIYLEGVEKGKVEAAQLIADAEHEAKAIIAKAQAEADKIKADAVKNASELDKNTKSELKLFAEQSVNAIKTEITNLLSDKIASDAVKAATSDKVFMQKTITALVEQWAKEGNVTIEAKDAKALTDYFMANAKELLNKGVSINEVKGLKTDFAIAPAQGGYKITFGNDEFIAYFKEFLRPKLVELLF
jgi:V/A-type H+/Na+-transporting ATPase subunit E